MSLRLLVVMLAVCGEGNAQDEQLETSKIFFAVKN